MIWKSILVKCDKPVHLLQDKDSFEKGNEGGYFKMRGGYWPAEWRLASEGHSFYLLIPHRTACATTVDVKKTLQVTNPETFVSNPRSHINSRVWLLHDISLYHQANAGTVSQVFDKYPGTPQPISKWSVEMLCHFAR